MTHRVFVSGAAGFVGSHLCQRLIQAGCEVHAVIRREDDELARLGVRMWVGDLWDAPTLKAALSGVDIVIHCAGDPSFGNGPQYHRANVELTRHLIDAVRTTCPGLQRFVFVSTIGAMDRPPGDSGARPLTEDSPAAPTSDYGRSKLQAEQLVRESGVPFSIVRPTMVVGADMRMDSHFAVFARHALRGSLMSRLAWPGRFSVIHVDDLAAALWLTATHPEAQGKTFFCAGEPMSVAECFAQSAPQARRLPLAWATTLAAPLVRWLPFPLRAMLTPALTASDQRLRQLGWIPRHSAQSALAEVIQREAARVSPELDPGGQTVITGAASGLGHALVERLAPLRKNVLLIDKDSTGLQRLLDRYPHCRAVTADLTDDAQLQQLTAQGAWVDQPITELYACAGIGLRGRMQDLPFEAHQKMFKLNTLARLHLGQAAIRTMRRRQFGRVVFISSSSAFQPLPFMATYAATNSALLSLGEAWAYETRDQGIQMMTVCPGGMQTNFQKSGGVKEVEGEKLMPPSEVAEQILQGLRAQRTTLIVSTRSLAMSLLARILPRALSVRLWGTLMEKMR